MSSLYLTSYIASPLFLEEIKKKNLPYDVILSDIPYEINPSELGETPFKLYTPANKPTNENLFSYRAKAIKQAQHPLFILGQLNLSSILASRAEQRTQGKL
jgi:hypothetical protein